MQFEHSLALVDKDTTEHDFAMMRQLRALVHYEQITAAHYLGYPVYQSGTQRPLTNPAKLTVVLQHST